jgi:hypothetical protein
MLAQISRTGIDVITITQHSALQLSALNQRTAIELHGTIALLPTKALIEKPKVSSTKVQNYTKQRRNYTAGN